MLKWSQKVRLDFDSVGVVLEGRTDYGELQAANALPVVFEDDEDAWAIAVIACELSRIGRPIMTPPLSEVWGEWFGIDVAEEQVRVDGGVIRFAAVDTGFDRTPRGFRVVVDLATLDVEVEELQTVVP